MGIEISPRINHHGFRKKRDSSCLSFLNVWILFGCILFFDEGRLPAAAAAGQGHACSCAAAAVDAAAVAAAAAAAAAAVRARRGCCVATSSMDV